MWEASNLLEFTTHPYEGEIYDGEGTPIRYSDQYRVDFLTGRTVRFLRQMQREPFLLVVSIYEPHYQDDLNRTVAPTGYAERYANPFVPQDLRFYPGDWQRELPDYYGCVARLDEAVGTILQTLSELELEENTIVVFTSDHGCHFHTRNPWNKYSAHDSSIRVPLAVQGPGFNRSLVIRQLTSHVDFAPTLLDMAGIPVPETMQGHSCPSPAGRADQHLAQPGLCSDQRVSRGARPADRAIRILCHLTDGRGRRGSGQRSLR